MRNPYKHISDEPVIGTQHGNPNLFVGKIDTIANLNQTLDTLNSFKDSLTFEQPPQVSYSSSSLGLGGGGGGSNGFMKGMDTTIDDITNKPIVRGGQITYEKKHSHK